METNLLEIKVKSEKMAIFLQENGANLLRSEFKNSKNKGSKIYYFENDSIFENILKLWEKEKELCYF